MAEPTIYAHDLSVLREELDRIEGHRKKLNADFLYIIHGDNGHKGILVRLDRIEQTAIRTTHTRDITMSAVAGIISALIVAAISHFIKG